jgi:hypothetical protein
VDNFYVFVSLVQTKEELRAAFKKAKNNLKAKAETGDARARQKLSGFTIEKLRVYTGPRNMGAFPTFKPGVQLPSDITGRIEQRDNMRRVLTNQGQQGVPPEFNVVLSTHSSYQLLDKYSVLPGQEVNSFQNDKQNFAKVRAQFISDCSNAVKSGVKNVLLSQKHIAFCRSSSISTANIDDNSSPHAGGTGGCNHHHHPLHHRCGSTCGRISHGDRRPPYVKSRGRSRSRHRLDEWGNNTTRFQFWSSNRRRRDRESADRRRGHGYVTAEPNAALGARKCISGCH